MPTRTSLTVRLRRAVAGGRGRWLRRAVLAGVIGVALLVAGAWASVSWIRSGAEGRTYTAQTVPEAPVALVLGTRVQPDGTPSPFLSARLEIARELYATGKVQAILVSGDNMRHEYNEPEAMQRWLVDRGVPADKVVLDYAGFDTYDSCARAKRIFGVDRATVVTQAFHLARAVTVCRHLGVDANGVGDETARELSHRTWRISSTREYGAGLKAALDVLSGRDPAHLGRRETGIEDALRAS
ncbi:protein SanA, affects membrane permeability for vancomycin [Micromonospora phaseoli]|uniref:Protein SanA, affects membrane permeability for vancomycin n=1 Tax=Micromonospora phaseoli TaxID=1144548 RepID=A0A1H6WTT4_9ACTN|nr:ElyC/SanA/YdcF family protein [Micromonospora phaseoli]PZW01944.1 vancomycin permeability regulator SanA [Micromonospora phaseoli]GIJ80922.1 membrane protein [Micromonospora phaseoli]SEJ20223.1 protein SanA, affects membrane permeability for vancomycin [Micromonospora phaseoli]